MRATADTIWQVPAYLPYVQPPLTDDTVAEAEAKIGYKVPVEYLHLLRKQNGGMIRYSPPQGINEEISGIGPYFPSLTKFEWDEEAEESVSYPLKGLVPFDGDGHWYLCLDYRSNPDSPSITVADVEADAEYPMSNSFADYLATLILRIGDEYVVESVADIEKTKADLASVLKVAFEPPDADSHGYPIHLARLGSRRNPNWLSRFRVGSRRKPNWLSISPNTVPGGFVRPDDPRYLELKDWLPGVAERYPEVPAGAYIIDAAEEVRSKVLDACARCGMTLRPLREYVQGS